MLCGVNDEVSVETCQHPPDLTALILSVAMSLQTDADRNPKSAEMLSGLSRQFKLDTTVVIGKSVKLATWMSYGLKLKFRRHQ